MSSAANTLPAWRRSSLPIALVGSLLLWASLPPLAPRMARLDCTRSMVAPCANGRPAGPTSVSRSLRGRARVLAGFDLLAVPAASDLEPRLVCSLGLSRHLCADFCRTDASRRASLFRFRFGWRRRSFGLAWNWPGHMLTGFLMASLAHTQVNWTMLIQISDLVGEYGVDFVVMLVAASIACQIPLRDQSRENRSPAGRPRPSSYRVGRHTCLRPLASG